MKLSQELKSKNINFKNRVVMPPMATAKADTVLWMFWEKPAKTKHL